MSSNEPAAPKRRWWPFGRQKQQQAVTSVEMLKTALEVRKQTVVVIQQVEREIAAATDIGQDIAQQLQKDKERIQQMNRAHSQAAPNVAAAVAHGRTLFRGLARDKCFLMLVILVVIMVIVVIIVAGVIPGIANQPKDLSTTTPAPTRPNTTRAPLRPNVTNTTRAPLNFTTFAPVNGTNSTNGTRANSLRLSDLLDSSSPWYWAVFD